MRFETKIAVQLQVVFCFFGFFLYNFLFWFALVEGGGWVYLWFNEALSP